MGSMCSSKSILEKVRPTETTKRSVAARGGGWGWGEMNGQNTEDFLGW